MSHEILISTTTLVQSGLKNNGLAVFYGLFKNQILFIHIWFVSEYFVTFVNEPKLFRLHTMKWFQELLFNTNNSIWPIGGTLTDTTTLGLSEPGSNANEEVLSRTGDSSSNAI